MLKPIIMHIAATTVIVVVIVVGTNLCIIIMGFDLKSIVTSSWMDLVEGFIPLTFIRIILTVIKFN